MQGSGPAMKTTGRSLPFHEAVREALDICLSMDPRVYVIGLGVPDPKGSFGTTLGLQEKYGSLRVMDMPTSENGMTGVAIGSALVGMRPVVIHQRVDFALLSLDPIVNQAAKWHYMFGAQGSVPMVIRAVIGRGWGQGAQHAQSLESWFAHIPGLKVVMPATPHDAKGLMIASILDNNPVIFLEHRWLHNTVGPVPEGFYRVPLGHARIAKGGKDITIVATSHMVVESLVAAKRLAEIDVEAEVIDLRTVRPLDMDSVVDSVAKTGRLLVADTGWKTCGVGSEIIAGISERIYDKLKCPPRRIGPKDTPMPSTPALAQYCYPRALHIVQEVCKMLNVPHPQLKAEEQTDSVPLDIPNPSFTGPF